MIALYIDLIGKDDEFVHQIEEKGEEIDKVANSIEVVNNRMEDDIDKMGKKIDSSYAKQNVATVGEEISRMSEKVDRIMEKNGRLIENMVLKGSNYNLKKKIKPRFQKQRTDESKKRKSKKARFSRSTSHYLADSRDFQTYSHVFKLNSNVKLTPPKKTPDNSSFPLHQNHFKGKQRKNRKKTLKKIKKKEKSIKKNSHSFLMKSSLHSYLKNNKEVSKRDQSLYPQPKVEIFPISSLSDTTLQLAEDPVNPNKLIAIKSALQDVNPNLNVPPSPDTADPIVKINPRNEEFMSPFDFKTSFSNETISSKRDESLSRTKTFRHTPYPKPFASDVEQIESRDIKNGPHDFHKHHFQSQNKRQDNNGGYTKDDHLGDSNESKYNQHEENEHEENDHEENEQEENDHEEKEHEEKEHEERFHDNSLVKGHHESYPNDEDHHVQTDNHDEPNVHDSNHYKKLPYRNEPYVTNEEFKPRFEEFKANQMEDSEETPENRHPSEKKFDQEMNNRNSPNHLPYFNHEDNYEPENREKLPSPFEERRFSNNNQDDFQKPAAFHDQEQNSEPYRHIELRTTNDGKNEYTSHFEDHPNKNQFNKPNDDFSEIKDARFFDQQYYDKYGKQPPEENDKYVGERVGDVIVEKYNPSNHPSEAAPYSKLPDNQDDDYHGRKGYNYNEREGENKKESSREGYGRGDTNHKSYKEDDENENDKEKNDSDNDNNDDNDNDEDDDDDGDDDDDNADEDNDDNDDDEDDDEKRKNKLKNKEDPDPAENEDVNWDDIAWQGEYGHAKYSESGKFSKPRMYTCMLEKMKSMHNKPMCATSKRHGLEKHRKGRKSRRKHRRRHRRRKKHRTNNRDNQFEKLSFENIKTDGFKEKGFPYGSPFAMQPVLKGHNKSRITDVAKRQHVSIENLKHRERLKNNPRTFIGKNEDFHNNLNLVHRVYHGEDHGDLGSLANQHSRIEFKTPMIKWSKFPPFSKMGISVHFKRKKKSSRVQSSRLRHKHKKKFPKHFSKHFPEHLSGTFPANFPGQSPDYFPAHFPKYLQGKKSSHKLKGIQNKILRKLKRISFLPGIRDLKEDRRIIDEDQKPNIEPMEINGNIVLAIPHMVQQLEDWQIPDMHTVYSHPK